MTPLSYHSSNLSLVARETMWLLVLITNIGSSKVSLSKHISISEAHVRLLLFESLVGYFLLIFKEWPSPPVILQNILKIENYYVDAGIYGMWSLYQVLGE